MVKVNNFKIQGQVIINPELIVSEDVRNGIKFKDLIELLK